MSSLYKGFYSGNWLKSKSLIQTGIDLVKQDLINHIYTRKGEYVMAPDFGTRIPDMIFEQNNENTRNIIESDLRKVFEYDPRIDLLSLNVYSLTDNNMIYVEAILYYKEYDKKDSIDLEIQTQ